MNVYIYGDESGVFDNKHQKYYVFGGVLFLDKSCRDDVNRQYLSLERKIAKSYEQGLELKAYNLKTKHRASLFKVTSKGVRYAFIIKLDSVHEKIFEHPKSKQRFLDYVYKVGLKRVLKRLMHNQALDPNKVNNIIIRFDEHNTATNGRYELREAIEKEFKIGTFNDNYKNYFEPIFPSMKGQVEVTFKDSRDDALIRASDIIANYAFRCANRDTLKELNNKVIVVRFP